MLPVNSGASSVTAMLAPCATGTSFVPVMVTVTTCDVPSIVLTVKISFGSVWPAPSA